jgi:group II intron reverse transcriptase/maturase
VSATTAIATLDKVAELQRALYRAAKDSPGRRFHALYDKVHRRDVLWRAWWNVARNGGAAGADGVTITMIEESGLISFLDDLAAELAEGRWRPTPVRRAEIPKPDGRTRPLGIPTVRDRVVQAALKIVLEPIFEADFSPSSFGFRPKRSAHHALNTIMDEAWAGRRVVVEADIASFFDEVDQDILMEALAERVVDRKVLKAIRALLGAGVYVGEQLLSSDTGTPQGGVVSPLLANVYLHRLDRQWERRHRGLGRLIRYADDLVIVCRYESQAERALVVLTEELARLKLRIQPAKTRIVNLKRGEGFDFLGFHHRWVAAKRHPGVWFLARWPSRRAMARARDRIRELTARWLLGRPVEAVVGSINRFLRGWGAYFRHGNSSACFDAIEHFVGERVMLFISKTHQKPGRWFGRRVLFNSPSRLGLVRLAGTVSAPRPNRWR